MPTHPTAPRGDPGATGEPLNLREWLRAGLATPAVREPLGRVRPGFTLLEKLGEGGAGEVFRAEETTPLRRTVAVKLRRSGTKPAECPECFTQEHGAFARLDHPHIVRVFEAGVDGAGRPYYSMELVDGPPLLHFCRPAH